MHLCLGQCICTLGGILARAHGLYHALSSLFTYGKCLNTVVKLFAIIILARANICIILFDERASAWRFSHIDVRHFRLSDTICSIWRIGTWTHGLDNSLSSFLTNSEGLGV